MEKCVKPTEAGPINFLMENYVKPTEAGPINLFIAFFF